MKVEQAGLLLGMKQEEVADSVVARCKDLKEAINLCVTVSGLPIKDIAYQLGYGSHPEQFTRMLTNGASLPPEKIDLLMNICGNEIPLRWLALNRGYGLHRLKSAVELENERLRAELEQKDREMSVIKAFFKDVKP